MPDINQDKFPLAKSASPTEQQFASSVWGQTPTEDLEGNGLVIKGSVGFEHDVLTKGLDGKTALTTPATDPGSFHTQAQTNTQDEPPSNQRIVFNEVTQNVSTELYIDYTTTEGTDIRAQMVLRIVPGVNLFIQLRSDQSRFIEFNVVTATDVTTDYLKVTGTVINDNGSQFGNNNQLTVIVLEGFSNVSKMGQTGNITDSAQLADAGGFSGRAFNRIRVNAAETGFEFFGARLAAQQENGTVVTTISTSGQYENANITPIPVLAPNGAAIMGSLITNTSGQTKIFLIVWSVSVKLDSGGASDSISIKVFKNESVNVSGQATTSASSSLPGNVSLWSFVTLLNNETLRLKIRNNTDATDIVIIDNSILFQEN